MHCNAWMISAAKLYGSISFFSEKFTKLCHNIGQTFGEDDKIVGKLALCSAVKSCDTNALKIMDMSRQIIGLKADVLD